ncbi:MAG TPA: hypothetical protein VMU62_03550, partial [Acidobacteriaceae bacterium]|nr:hypothetical protein [Acidobacteriaceae bacterium]
RGYIVLLDVDVSNRMVEYFFLGWHPLKNIKNTRCFPGNSWKLLANSTKIDGVSFRFTPGHAHTDGYGSTTAFSSPLRSGFAAAHVGRARWFWLGQRRAQDDQPYCDGEAAC